GGDAYCSVPLDGIGDGYQRDHDQGHGPVERGDGQHHHLRCGDGGVPALSLLICTPMYGGLCTAGYWRSTLALEAVFNDRKIAHDWLETTNESLITRGRNTSAARFLKGDWSKLFFIDADIEFEPEDVAHLWNLCEAGADVAVGCYPRKELKAEYAAWVNGRLLKAAELDKIKN